MVHIPKLLPAAIVLIVLVLSGCGAAEPTPDPSALATSVAQEVFATLTAEAVAQVPTPTDTAVATDTPFPTDTPSPTATIPPTETSTPTLTPTRAPTNTPRPTFTPTPRPGIGSVVRCDDMWEVSVFERPSTAKRLNVLDTSGYLTFSDAESAKGQWLLLLFNLTNLQAETNDLSWLDDELAVKGQLNGRAVAFEPSDWGTSRAQRSQGISDWGDDVPPGITIKALAIFDVNPDATDLQLVIQGHRDFDKICETSIFLEDAPVPEGQAVAVASGAVNVRTGPGTNYPVAGQTRSGQRLQITGKTSDASWLKVLFDGKDAWVAASVAPASGSLDDIPVETDVPPPPATATPKATATPLPRIRSDQEYTVGIWGIRLYDVKRAKAVYFFNDAELAAGVWLTPLVELRNLGSNAAQPSHNLDFYLQDDRGRIYEFDTFGDGVLGAAWQYQTGKLYGDINPGLVIGTSLPFDVPPDMGDVWLRLHQDPNFVMYLGNASQLPETQ